MLNNNIAHIKTLLVLLWAMLGSCLYAQTDTIPDNFTGSDSTKVDTVPQKVVYVPTATFDNFDALKKEVGNLGLGSKYECMNESGLYHACYFEPYLFKVNYEKKAKITITVIGNNDKKANLILISTQFLDPDQQAAREFVVDLARKVMNMLGEPFSTELRGAIINKTDLKKNTLRGYYLRAKNYNPTNANGALDIKIDATGME